MWVLLVSRLRMNGHRVYEGWSLLVNFRSCAIPMTSLSRPLGTMRPVGSPLLDTPHFFVGGVGFRNADLAMGC